MQLSVASIFLATILGVYFFKRKKSLGERNVILSLFFFSYAIVLTSFLVKVPGEEFTINIAATLGAMLELVTIPLFYLYLRTFYTQDRFSKKDIVHFVPYIIACICALFYFQHTKKYYYLGHYRVVTAVYLAIWVCYFLIINTKFKLYTIFTKPESCGFKRNVLQWLRYFTITCVALWVLKAFHFLSHTNVLDHSPWCAVAYGFITLNVLLYLNITIYLCLFFPDLFTSHKKYQKDQIDEEQKALYKQKLISYLESEKPYLDPYLTLSLLSDSLGISKNHLSQIINETFRSSFNNFINEYRIKHSKELLKDPHIGKVTILEIANSSGFNSKTTFNAAFKKYTGLTPKEFRKAK